MSDLLDRFFPVRRVNRARRMYELARMESLIAALRADSERRAVEARECQLCVEAERLRATR